MIILAMQNDPRDWIQNERCRWMKKKEKQESTTNNKEKLR